MSRLKMPSRLSLSSGVIIKGLRMRQNARPSATRSPRASTSEAVPAAEEPSASLASISYAYLSTFCAYRAWYSSRILVLLVSPGQFRAVMIAALMLASPEDSRVLKLSAAARFARDRTW